MDPLILVFLKQQYSTYTGAVPNYVILHTFSKEKESNCTQPWQLFDALMGVDSALMHNKTKTLTERLGDMVTSRMKSCIILPYEHSSKEYLNITSPKYYILDVSILSVPRFPIRS